MTEQRHTTGPARALSGLWSSRCPLAPACLLGCLGAAGLGGMLAWYGQAGPFWSLLTGLAVGQIAFALACLRLWLNGTYTMPGRSEEIEADLAAFAEPGAKASSR